MDKRTPKEGDTVEVEFEFTYKPQPGTRFMRVTIEKKR